MTNKEAVKGVMKIWTGYTAAYAEVSHEDVEAISMAIEVLSKQGASGGQADKSVIVDFVAFQREWLNSHKTLELDAVNNALVNIFLRTTGKAFIDVLSQTAANDEAIRTDDHITEPDKMVNDQFRDSAKKTEDVPDNNAGKTEFKPGDKFILELGQERRMFGEFEIAGTDLYVKIDLLEKLTRFEPEKFEIHNDHTDCIWYHYLDDDDDVPNNCPSTCSQYRDGWNDAMKYIYCDGKGYQPYTRKAK